MGSGGAGPQGKGTAQRDFPPRIVGKAIKAALACAHYSLVAALAYAAYAAGARLHALHTAGELLPLLEGYATAAVALPPGLTAAQAAAGLAGVALAGAAAAWLLVWRHPQPIYLLDFECYRPEKENMVTYQRFGIGSRAVKKFDDESMAFQERILQKSGLSQETFFPPGLHCEIPEYDMRWARVEAELVMFNAVADLLAKTGLQPRQIDVLVTNCSLFCPTPSLAAMIINHFKMRSDIEAFNLGGMGCSAGMLSIDLAQKLLKEKGRGGYALVVSTESITQNWYHGNERSMLIPNTIFRMGSAAILLTNKRSEARRAKYSLEHVVRCHLGADDVAYKCVYQRPDERNIIGVELSKDLVKVAAKAMELNLTRLGPLVLPWSEKLMFAANWVARKVLRMCVPRYIPDFRQAFDHFCLHAGGRAVVQGLSKQLGLSPTQMAPSANTLHWYGNTSSSTVWYSFGFVESVQGVRRGDVVWQIGFGSGFKCNSVVWRALRPIKTMHKAWEHIEGRESQALDTLARIDAETAAERQQAQAAAANGHANGKATTSPAKPARRQRQEEQPAAANRGDASVTVGRSLRSGKVV